MERTRIGQCMLQFDFPPAWIRLDELMSILVIFDDHQFKDMRRYSLVLGSI
jgi:hypothetical protein